MGKLRFSQVLLKISGEALAGGKAFGLDGPTIQANMAAVSGSNGGTECTGWVECSDLVLAGEDIIYKSISNLITPKKDQKKGRA